MGDLTDDLLLYGGSEGSAGALRILNLEDRQVSCRSGKLYVVMLTLNDSVALVMPMTTENF